VNKIAAKLIQLAILAKAATWHTRRPSAEMIKELGDVRAFIEMPRPGKPYGCEVLAEDYEGDDEMREAHLQFIATCAGNVEALAKSWLQQRLALEEIGNAIGCPTMSYSPNIERMELLKRVGIVSNLVQKGLANV
jgi:hypothetical protein